MSEKKYVLIVDDDPDLVETVGMLLESKGFEEAPTDPVVQNSRNRLLRTKVCYTAYRCTMRGRQSDNRSSLGGRSNP